MEQINDLYDPIMQRAFGVTPVHMSVNLSLCMFVCSDSCFNNFGLHCGILESVCTDYGVLKSLRTYVKLALMACHAPEPCLSTKTKITV